MRCNMNKKSIEKIFKLILEEANKQVKMQKDLEKQYGISFDSNYINEAPDLTGLLINIAEVCAGGDPGTEEGLTDYIFDYLLEGIGSVDKIAKDMATILAIEGE